MEKIQVPTAIKFSKHQLNRYSTICKDNLPNKIRCYDNGGKTADRYTVVFTGNYTGRTGGQYWFLNASENPSHAWGVGLVDSSPIQIDKPTYSHLGKKITYEQLPEDVQKFVINEYLYLWDFVDHNAIWLTR